MLQTQRTIPHSQGKKSSVFINVGLFLGILFCVALISSVSFALSACTGYFAHPFLKTRRGQRFERARIYNFLHASAEQAQSTFLTSAPG
jgi:hypothetical protein